MAHTAVTTAVVLAFALVEWAVEKFVADHSRLAGTIIEITIVVIATLAFRPIHQRVEDAVEAAFMKRKREAHAALHRLRSELTSFNDASQLLRRVIEGVQMHMSAEGCAVYVRRDAYHAEASSFDSPAPVIALDDALAVRLRSRAGPVETRALHSDAPGTLAFPMMAAGELIGFLTVALTHDDLESDDRQMLALFAEALGLALLGIDPQLRAGKTAKVNHNLPSGFADLIGREHDLAELHALLQRSRLVTIVGTGGTGKTRIACEVAANSAGADGAWFVDLAPFTEGRFLAGAIAHVFNIADEGVSRPLIETVAQALQNKQLLLVLDNCEQVIEAAAQAASVLLKSCPGVRILTTSREPLGIAGESVYQLPVLAVPPQDGPMTAQRVAEYPAAALFIERAKSAQRTFEVTDANAGTIADIVRRLDGIPLAIELAAPRIKALSLEQIDRRLDERFTLLSGGNRASRERHQTLRALIGWSYDLLTPGEQSLLRCSSIFRGSWTLEALEAVGTAAEKSVLDGLLALVDKSLVAVDSGENEHRYRLLESTRAFAAEQLDAQNERAGVASLHAAFFNEIALRHGDAYWQTDSAEWCKDVRRDLENIRASIDYGLASENGAGAAGAIAGLRWYWYIVSRREGRALLERAHGARLDALTTRLRGLLALASATLDYSAQAALPASEASIALNGLDAPGYAEALTFEGVALGRSGRLQEAIAVFENALAAARVTKAPRLIGWVLSMVAYWIGATQDGVRARDFFDEAADLLRSSNDAWQLARLQLHRAEFLYAQGDPGGALASVHEAEGVFRERSGELGLCVSVLNSAAYLIALARLDEAWERAREGLEIAIRLETSIPGAWAISHLARLAAETQDVERAARLLGYADEAYRATGSTREPTEQSGYDRTLALIREFVPEERVRVLMAEGAALEQEAAVTHAFAVVQPGKPETSRG